MRQLWTTRNWSLIAGLAVLLAVSAVALGADSAPAAQAAQAAGTAGFLKDNGLEGRVAFIQFGAIGCPLSEEGIGRMAVLNKDKKIDGLAFARVEAVERSKDTEGYFAAKSPGFPICYDTDGALANAFDANAWPTYVLVDKFGRVRYRGSWPDEAKLAEWAGTLATATADAGPDAAMLGAATLNVPELLDKTRLPDLESTDKSLRERMGAKGLLVAFVDTTCPFSGTAIGEISNVASVLAKQEIQTVLVNIGEPKDVVKRFYAERNLGVPVMYDTGKTMQAAWGITSVPTIIVIDPSGAILYRGKAVWADVGTAVEKGLNLPAGSLTFTVKGTGKG